MQPRRRIKPTEIALLVAPVLLLALVAWWQSRRAPVATGPFAFKLESVHFKRLLSPQRNNWRMAVWAYVGHTGARPEWWGNPGTTNGSFKDFRFIAENNSVHGPVAWSTLGDKRPFDKERQQYCFQAIVNVGRPRKAMGRTTMVSVVSVMNYGTGKWVDLEVVRDIKDDWPGQ